MDIKLTKHRKKLKGELLENDQDRKKDNVVTAVVAVIILLLSFFMIYRYHNVEIKLKENNTNTFENRDYASDIFYSNYYLYYKKYQSENNKLLRPSELYLTKDTIDSMIANIDVDYYSSKLDYETVRNSFDNVFDGISNFILNSDGNIKYMSINKDTGYKITNYDFKSTIDNIDNFRKADKDKENYNQIKNSYEETDDYIKKNFINFLVMDYDAKGQYKLVYSQGLDFEKMNNYFLNLESDKNLGEIYALSDIEYSESFSDFKVESIKNTRFIYAIPKSIDNSFYSKNDTISSYINRHERNSYATIETLGRNIILAIVVILILTPSKLISGFRGIKSIFKLPFELILIIFYFVERSLMSNDVPIRIVRETITGNLLKSIISKDIGINLAKQIVNFLNISYWFIIFMSVVILTLLFKKILESGVVKYFKQRSAIILILSIICKNTCKFILGIINADFKNRINRMCLIGVIIGIIGSIALAITSPNNFIPWIISIVIYVIVVAFYIKIVMKELSDSNDDYEKLVGLTRDLANGKLDKDIINEDVGVYEELKRQLISLQLAYKMSVQEEIKSQRMKSELISNVSHDLKTPLTSIISYADLLRNSNVGEENKKYIDTIYRKSERLKLLIDDIFEISKAQTGNIKLEMAPLDIVELTKQTIGEISDRLNSKNVVLITKYPQQKVIVNIDGERTYRIFENLLVNISKYAMENSRAYLDIIEQDNIVDIVFRNISATEIDFEADEVMERFKRGDKSRNTEGSGLGISIAKSYTEIQGGKFKIKLDGDLFKVIISFPKAEI
ncbi:sensor histidine kinase [Peptostreptococcus equinus]|uniref:histidine kinase n=1 Tax=Peptostreptococcus equinus TaxID=3003601 RepID=A0ABY7JQA7_9FIRM|nr:sensor histidine kinase [Peptostreptococcus sp. CBA3647]WAW14223.1 sensor histidine kinase [Peptostreptococcus sp. CBA3647]